MSRTERPRHARITQYLEVRPLLRHVRVMERVMEWVDDDPVRRKFHAEMYGVFMDILQEEFAEHAITLAMAICELEDAFPEIVGKGDVQS
jgi:hypothetical protein